eukprot:CAMPEP_0170597628 /NCGR_PEP_ID=MMETSP0224-20130122/15808_1 /TAXON_ID=285029 /ORGANISM="Togula jolla, Strain CCCM 725" /LENGTH=124 /DNA_ID=CAMNT_0010922111 /DNA_START=59 /DNA_END=430 /DNA_ORIENTATION=+
MAPEAQARRCRAVAVAAVGLAACCFVLSNAFVAPSMGSGHSRDVSVVAAHAAGEYTGFVPDLQRRTLMNLVVTATSLIPVGVLLYGFVTYLLPPTGGGAGGASLVGDATGAPVALDKWMKNHKD